MQATDSAAVASLSIWDPVHLGFDELYQAQSRHPRRAQHAHRRRARRRKVRCAQLPVAHAALSADCRLILIDGKRVELGLWRGCSERIIGPSIDNAIETRGWL